MIPPQNQDTKPQYTTSSTTETEVDTSTHEIVDIYADNGAIVVVAFKKNPRGYFRITDGTEDMNSSEDM
jgi:hypothetical protein